MKPIIGVSIRKEQEKSTSFLKVDENNINAILNNGGLPFMLPLTDDDYIIEKYLNIVDGLYFTGGNDIFPMHYGEEPINELGNIILERDEFEIKLYNKAASRDMPMLGVCRGYELMNVASGGTLYQDIYKQRNNTNGHSPKNIPADSIYHTVELLEGTFLQRIFETKVLKTNSFHHQAIKDVADGYKIAAHSRDGIIEAIESENLTFAIGVQWHPEDMIKSYNIFNKIYIALIDAALEYNKNKNTLLYPASTKQKKLF